MSNPLNIGTLTGRLARDPKVFENTDGSKKVLFTVMVDRGYTTADGVRVSDGIPVETFVSKTASSIGPYGYIHKGDLVQVQVTLQHQRYVKNGNEVFETKVIAEDISFLEPRSVTEARLAERAAQAETPAAPAAPAQESAPAEAPAEELPFAAPAL